ncbi:septum formation initiator family protein [Haloimpatiens sp. FM7330]|uniref:FtsB family cell division protein n=1 Tax=Haloimpatiens sp. FM7330 TaxID=3298610 RepID=UPI00363782BB
MNKVIMMNKEDIEGNTVLSSNANVSRPKEKNNVERDNKRESFKNAKKRNAVKKLKVIRNIGIVFAVGMVLVCRYAYICNIKQEVLNTKQEITKAKKENESLKIRLLKYNNLEYIEKYATEKLNMVKPSMDNAVYCDLNKKNYNKNKNTNDDSKSKNNLIEFIKNKLF